MKTEQFTVKYSMPHGTTWTEKANGIKDLFDLLDHLLGNGYTNFEIKPFEPISKTGKTKTK